MSSVFSGGGEKPPEVVDLQGQEEEEEAMPVPGFGGGGFGGTSGGGAAGGGGGALWSKEEDFGPFTSSEPASRRGGGFGDHQDSDDFAIPGLGGPTAAANAQTVPDSDESMQWNRKQKRAMEKEKRKEGKNPVKSARAAEKAKTSGISTPIEAEITSGPVGAKKRTRAENGKILIVDSVGNVFLEEETEEGDVQEFLLDVSILLGCN